MSSSLGSAFDRVNAGPDNELSVVIPFILQVAKLDDAFKAVSEPIKSGREWPQPVTESVWTQHVEQYARVYDREKLSNYENMLQFLDPSFYKSFFDFKQDIFYRLDFNSAPGLSRFNELLAWRNAHGPEFITDVSIKLFKILQGQTPTNSVNTNGAEEEEEEDEDPVSVNTWDSLVDNCMVTVLQLSKPNFSLYAKVVCKTPRYVMIQFDEHYAQLHGTSHRQVMKDEVKKFKFRLSAGTEFTPSMMYWNALQHWRHCESETYREKGITVRLSDKKDFMRFFDENSGLAGQAYTGSMLVGLRFTVSAVRFAPNQTAEELVLLGTATNTQNKKNRIRAGTYEVVNYNEESSEAAPFVTFNFTTKEMKNVSEKELIMHLSGKYLKTYEVSYNGVETPIEFYDEHTDEYVLRLADGTETRLSYDTVRESLVGRALIGQPVYVPLTTQSGGVEKFPGRVWDYNSGNKMYSIWYNDGEQSGKRQAKYLTLDEVQANRVSLTAAAAAGPSLPPQAADQAAQAEETLGGRAKRNAKQPARYEQNAARPQPQPRERPSRNAQPPQRFQQNRMAHIGPPVDSGSDDAAPPGLAGLLWLHRPLLQRLQTDACFPLISDTTASLETIFNRIDACIRAARLVFRPQGQALAVDDDVDEAEDATQEADADVEAVAEADADVSKCLIFPSRSSMGWSQTPRWGAKDFHWGYACTYVYTNSTLDQPFEVDAGNESFANVKQRSDIFKARAGQRLQNNWTPFPTSDSLRQVVDSGLLNNVQLSSLYSVIGVRAHLRLAFLWLYDGNFVNVNTHDNIVPLQKYNEDKKYFAQFMLANTAVTAYGNRSADAPATFVGEKSLFVRQGAFQFATSNDDQLQVRQFSENIYAGLEAKISQYFTVTYNSQCSAKIISAELPVFNKYAMFSKKEKSNKCFFHMTQLDVLILVKGAGDKNFLCVADYKTLMEGSDINPEKRILNKANIQQVLLNARMLESMIDCRISYGMVIYGTRRATADIHILAFPLWNTNFSVDYTLPTHVNTILNPFPKRRTVYVDPYCQGAGVNLGADDVFPYTRQASMSNLVENQLNVDGDETFYMNDMLDADYRLRGGLGQAVLVYIGPKTSVVNADPRPRLQSTLTLPVGGGQPPGGPARPPHPPAGPSSDGGAGAEPPGGSGAEPPPPPPQPQPPPGQTQFAAPHLNTRLVNPSEGANNEQLRKQIYRRVKEGCETLWADRVADDSTAVLTRANLNSLFQHMKDFLFDNLKYRLRTPRRWAESHQSRQANGAHGQFDDIFINNNSARVTLQRMLLANFNAPSSDYPYQHPRAAQFIGVLIRTLHRLINDDVMVHFFILPNMQRDPASFIGGSTSITVQRFAEKFLHLSQRPWWSIETLRYAENNLTENMEKLKAQLTKWHDALV